MVGGPAMVGRPGSQQKMAPGRRATHHIVVGYIIGYIIGPIIEPRLCEPRLSVLDNHGGA